MVGFAGVTAIEVSCTGAAWTVTAADPSLNPCRVAATLIVPADVGFTDVAKMPLASVTPFALTPAPLRVTVEPPAAVIFAVLTLLVLSTVMVSGVDKPAVTVVGFAATFNENTGYA